MPAAAERELTRDNYAKASATVLIIVNGTHLDATPDGLIPESRQQRSGQSQLGLADSCGKRTTGLAEGDVTRRPVAEEVARPMIELLDDRGKRARGQRRRIGALGKIRPQEPAAVLVGAGGQVTTPTDS
jgi:hypothetical protein